MIGKVGVAYRYYFALKTGSGGPRTGAAAAVTATVRNPQNTATDTPAITEVGGGRYFFDIAAAFTTTHGAGEYGIHLDVTVAPRDQFGESVPFFIRNVDDLAQPGDAMDLVADAVDAAALAASAVTEIQAGLATAAAVASVQADTDDIQSRLPAALVSGKIDAALNAAGLAADATAEIADGVWDEALAGHLVAGSTGKALDDAQDAGSPSQIAAAVWDEALPGAHAAGSAGERLATTDDRVDVAVSTRAAPGAAMTLTTAERDAVANAILDLANGVETPHTVRQALRIVLAAVAGKTSGGPATQVFRNLADTADRLTTVADGSGNRTSAVATP
jgi:hypothetical protein